MQARIPLNNSPAFRLDIKRAADVIEEIARIYGYHKIQTTIPKASITAVNSNRKRTSVLRIKDIVRKSGFNEAINYSFMNEADMDLLHIPEGDGRRKAISIKNPLRKEDSLLRTTLIPGLIGNFIYNFSRGIKDIKIFEVSRVFEDIGRPLPLEITYMEASIMWKNCLLYGKKRLTAFILSKA